MFRAAVRPYPTGNTVGGIMGRNRMQSREPKYMRNRFWARFVLLASILTIAGVYAAEYHFGKTLLLSWLSFTAEAVLIASVADGIAIYSLTNKIPFPVLRSFTGLVENKRDALLNGIVEAFRQKFYPVEKLRGMVAETNVVEAIRRLLSEDMVTKNGATMGRFLSKILLGHRQTLADVLIQQADRYINHLDAQGITRFAQRRAREKGWLRHEVASVYDSLYGWVASDGFREWAIDIFRNEAVRGEEVADQAGLLRKGAALFRNTIHKGKIRIVEWTGQLNYPELASALQKAIIKNLDMLIKRGDEHNKWTVLEELLAEMLLDLASTERFTDEICAWKADMIGGKNVKPLLISGIESAAKWLEDGKITSSGAKVIDDIDVSQWLSKTILIGLERVEQKNVNLQENFTKLANQFIDNEYEEVLNIVREILEGLTPDTLVKNVNDIAGGSLQQLRLTGALVGGVFGACLFLAIRFPLIGVPVVFMIAMALRFTDVGKRALISYSTTIEAHSVKE